MKAEDLPRGEPTEVGKFYFKKPGAVTYYGPFDNEVTCLEALLVVDEWKLDDQIPYVVCVAIVPEPYSTIWHCRRVSIRQLISKVLLSTRDQFRVSLQDIKALQGCVAELQHIVRSLGDTSETPHRRKKVTRKIGGGDY